MTERNLEHGSDAPLTRGHFDHRINALEAILTNLAGAEANLASAVANIAQFQSTEAANIVSLTQQLTDATNALVAETAKDDADAAQVTTLTAQVTDLQNQLSGAATSVQSSADQLNALVPASTTPASTPAATPPAS